MKFRHILFFIPVLTLAASTVQADCRLAVFADRTLSQKTQEYLALKGWRATVFAGKMTNWMIVVNKDTKILRLSTVYHNTEKSCAIHGDFYNVINDVKIESSIPGLASDMVTDVLLPDLVQRLPGVGGTTTPMKKTDCIQDPGLWEREILAFPNCATYME